VVVGEVKLDKLKVFCLFVGYSRSGSSAVGAMLDSHPNAIIVHEAKAVYRVFDQGFDRQRLFDYMMLRNKVMAEEGRTSPHLGGKAYNQSLTGQVKTSRSRIYVLGDKKAGSCLFVLDAKGPECIVGRLKKFQRFMRLPVRLVHVIRNPFDIFAALYLKNPGAAWPMLSRWARDIDVLKKDGSFPMHDLYLADLLENGGEEMAKVVRFLGLRSSKAFEERCRKHTESFQPHRRRDEVGWNSEMNKQVKSLIEKYEFFSGYKFE
jgi:hypothetical protein